MNNFNELVKKEESTLSIEEREFLLLHKEITYCSTQSVAYLIDTCKKLKEMRDTKKYVVAGFKTFSDYTENALQIKERQAYKYISVLENLPSDFLHSSAKLGITKLALISTLDGEDREQLMSDVAVEDISVAKLKEEIEKYKSKNEQLTIELDDVQKQVTKLKDDAKDGSKKEKEVEKYKADLKKAKDLQLKKEIEINELKRKITDLQNAPAEVKEVVSPDLTLKLETAEQKNEELVEKVAKLQKQVELSSADENFAKFKVKFKDFQLDINELLALLNTLSESNKEKCKSAIRKVLEGVKI